MTYSLNLVEYSVIELIKSNTSESPSELRHTSSNGLTKDKVLELVQECITSQLSSASLGNGLTRESIEDIVKAGTDGLQLEIERLREEVERLKVGQNIPLSTPEQTPRDKSADESALTSQVPRKISEVVDLKTATEATWNQFCKALEMPVPENKSAATGKEYETKATGWKYNGKKQKFCRITSSEPEA